MDAIRQGPWNRVVAAVAEPDLAALMATGGDALAEHLVAAALEREADDNVTAVAVDLLGEP